MMKVLLVASGTSINEKKQRCFFINSKVSPKVHMARKFLLFLLFYCFYYVINGLRFENFAEKFACFLALNTCLFQFKVGLYRGRKRTSV